MKIKTLIHKNTWKDYDKIEIDNNKVDIVFVFGTRQALEKHERFYELKEFFPNAHIVGSSSSGNVLGAEVTKDLVATALSFDSSHTKISSLEFKDDDNVEKLSKNLIDNLPKENLKHIFVLCDGLRINGSELVRGINKINPNTPITGGTAADNIDFEKTLVLADDIPKERSVVAVGFYGEKIHISNSAFSGWSEFGAQRVITKSQGNVVYEIDNEPALDLYKKYLEDEAINLPGSALKFPISIKEDDSDTEVIRTVIGVDTQDKSISFAGDVPAGYIAKFMKADIDMLIEGAKKAALAIDQFNNKPALALAVSCSGRINVMNQLVDDELEVMEEVLGENVKLSGFYSYGELGPFKEKPNVCQFHNQTMTLTTIYEE